MLRWTVVLCAGLYFALLLGGREGGPVREGLRHAAAPVTVTATTAPAADAGTDTLPPPVEVAEPLQPGRLPETDRASPALPAGIAPMPVVADTALSSGAEAVFSLAGASGDGAEAAPMRLGGAEFALVTDETAAAALSLATTPASAEDEPAAPSPAAPADIRAVLAAAVNVRTGPSTGDAVIGRLVRGEEVQVIRVETNGWARVRIEGDGIEGYVAERFLARQADG